VAGQIDAVGVVHDAIEDGVGVGWIAPPFAVAKGPSLTVSARAGQLNLRSGRKNGSAGVEQKNERVGGGQV